jgi:hypothetical protein
MVLGTALCVVGSQPLSKQDRAAARAMSCIATTVLAAMLSALLGWWALGGIILVIAVLLVAQVAVYFWLSG